VGFLLALLEEGVSRRDEDAREVSNSMRHDWIEAESSRGFGCSSGLCDEPPQLLLIFNHRAQILADRHSLASFAPSDHAGGSDAKSEEDQTDIGTVESLGKGARLGSVLVCGLALCAQLALQVSDG
jgi:hypothetical protein